MKYLLTADATVRACCADLFEFPGSSQPLAFFFSQRANRTDLHALAAKNAFAVVSVIRQIAAGDNLAVLAAITLRDGAVDDDLITGLNTAAAKNAFTEIADDERILIICRRNVRYGFFFKPQTGNFIEIGQILQAAVPVCFAGHAIMFSAGKQQLNI